LEVSVLSQDRWESLAPGLAAAFPDEFPGVVPDRELVKELEARSEASTDIFVVPRGVGPTEWSRDPRKRTQIRRRFMQLGQTAATMQIYDVRRALQALDQVAQYKGRPRNVNADGDAAVWTLYAALFEDHIDRLTLTHLPMRNRDAPDLLNVSRFVEMPHVVRMAETRAGTLHLSEEWDKVLDE
jgi:hypothetical protein